MSVADRMKSNIADLEKFLTLPELLARVEDDQELLVELLSMFREELPGIQDTLRHAIDAGDCIEAAPAAHALKGMLANLSMKPGASLAATIEEAARAGDMPKCREAFAALEAQTPALLAALAAFTAGN